MLDLLLELPCVSISFHVEIYCEDSFAKAMLILILFYYTEADKKCVSCTIQEEVMSSIFDDN